MSFYESLLRPLLFRLNAEAAHHFTLGQLSVLPPALLRALFPPPAAAPRTIFGVDFPHPVGLAAGLDKNAVALPAWEALGFGFIEIGTVTALPQPGNPTPRLFRYPAQQALINRMGFNNEGAEAIALRLARLRASDRWPSIPVGVNLGKSKATPLEDAPADYLESFRHLRDYGDYFVVNVSSPNTVGLRDLQEIDPLRRIVRGLRQEDPAKPLLVKIAPDLEDTHALEIAYMAAEEGIAGLIATNTTLNHSSIPEKDDQIGGLSGAPLRARSTHFISLLRAHSALPIIASGGVMDAAGGQEKFDAGADLVQIYTGFIYHGPQLIRDIVSLNSQTPRPSS